MVTEVGGQLTFTCEYHGDDDVSKVTWAYNQDQQLAGSTVLEVWISTVGILVNGFNDLSGSVALVS